MNYFVNFINNASLFHQFFIHIHFSIVLFALFDFISVILAYIYITIYLLLWQRIHLSPILISHLLKGFLTLATIQCLHVADVAKLWQRVASVAVVLPRCQAFGNALPDRCRCQHYF